MGCSGAVVAVVAKFGLDNGVKTWAVAINVLGQDGKMAVS